MVNNNFSEASVAADELKRIRKPELWTRYSEFMRQAFSFLQRVYETNFLDGFVATNAIEEEAAAEGTTTNIEPTPADVVTTEPSERTSANEHEHTEKVATSQEPPPGEESGTQPPIQTTAAATSSADLSTVSVPPTPKPKLATGRIVKKYDPALWEHLKQKGFPFEKVIGEMKSVKVSLGIPTQAETGTTSSSGGSEESSSNVSVRVLPFTDITEYYIPSYQSFVEQRWLQITKEYEALYNPLIELSKTTNAVFSRFPWDTMVITPLLLDAKSLAEDSQGFIQSERKILLQYLHFEGFLYDPFVHYKMHHFITNLTLAGEPVTPSVTVPTSTSVANSEPGSSSSPITSPPTLQQQLQEAEQQVSGMDAQEQDYEQWKKLVTSNSAKFKVAEEKVRGYSWCGIELEEGYEIRYPLSSDITFYGQDPVKSSLNYGNYDSPAFLTPLVEVEVILPKAEPNLSLYHEEATNILLALRLFRPQAAIGLEPLTYYVAEYPELLMQTPHYKYEAHSGTPLVLSVEEAEDFKQFWKELRSGLLPFRFQPHDFHLEQHQLHRTKAPTKKEKATAKATSSKSAHPLEVAVDRFSSSYEQWLPANQILDIVIGLESIFSEASDSIKYKYALRAALATGRNNQERQELFKNLKTAYDIRSKLAHGAKLENKIRKILEDRASAEQFAVEMRTVLARSIVRMARWLRDYPSSSSEDFLTEIDANLLKTDSYPFWIW